MNEPNKNKLDNLEKRYKEIEQVLIKIDPIKNKN